MARTMYIPKREVTKTKIELAAATLRREGVKYGFTAVSVYRGQTASNKKLCGLLSSQCDMMREHNIPYPW